MSIYNVKDYGATGGGDVLDTPGVNAAIAAAAIFGGTVLFPEGIYLCYSIHLQSNVLLYLEPGCIILAADSPLPGQTTGQFYGSYDLAEGVDPAISSIPGMLDAVHFQWQNALIWADGQSNIGIAGPGMICGAGFLPEATALQDRNLPKTSIIKLLQV